MGTKSGKLMTVSFSTDACKVFSLNEMENEGAFGLPE